MAKIATIRTLSAMTWLLLAACADSHEATTATAGERGAEPEGNVKSDGNAKSDSNAKSNGNAKEDSSAKDEGAAAAEGTRNANDDAAQLAMDECGLATRWGGDQYCIQPPPADKGFQVHIGPADYDNPDPRYVLEPGQEVTEIFPATSGNDREVYYYYRQYRMRPGSHHMIIMTTGSELRRLGGSQNLAKDNPDLGIIPPENRGVGMKLGPSTPLLVNLHYINATSAPILKEVWVNFWYKDAAEVTEPAFEMFSGTPMNVAPGEHRVIRGECPLSEAGRLLTVYGHRHANNRRFSVWRTHDAQQDLIYEDYDWEDPLVLEFNSTLANTAADSAKKTAGGWSGELDLVPGDKLSFECDIVNATDRTFVGRNEALDDEMCILVGDTAGARVPPRCSSTSTLLP